jgi:hypothetical protein
VLVVLVVEHLLLNHEQDQESTALETALQSRVARNLGSSFGLGWASFRIQTMSHPPNTLGKACRRR